MSSAKWRSFCPGSDELVWNNLEGCWVSQDIYSGRQIIHILEHLRMKKGIKIFISFVDWIFLLGLVLLSSEAGIQGQIWCWLDDVFNSLWPSDTIWQHISRSTLDQVMACCLTAPSHYLNQCWLIISKVQWHPSECNFTRDTSAISHWN